MKTTTCINASALLAVAAVTLGIANWDVEQAAAAFQRTPGTALPAFTADIDTQWLPAPAARNLIEERTALIERFASEHDIALRVLDSAAQVRTRDAAGERLAVPVVRLARSFEFRLDDPHEIDLLRGTLSSWSVQLRRAAPVSLQAATAGPSF